jgi:hypothetical protein
MIEGNRLSQEQVVQVMGGGTAGARNANVSLQSDVISPVALFRSSFLH